MSLELVLNGIDSLPFGLCLLVLFRSGLARQLTLFSELFREVIEPPFDSA